MYIRRKVFSISERNEQEIEKAFSKGYTEMLKKIAEDADFEEVPGDGNNNLPKNSKAKLYFKKLAKLISNNPGKTAAILGGAGLATAGAAYYKKNKKKNAEEKTYSELIEEAYTLGSEYAQKEFSALEQHLAPAPETKKEAKEEVLKATLENKGINVNKNQEIKK